jgi:predicted nucleotidyltransferase
VSSGRRGEGRRVAIDLSKVTSIFHFMKVKAPALLPILRSASQARLLTTLLLSPGQEFTLTELAAKAGVSLSTATREIHRAEAAGVALTRAVGPACLARADVGGVLYEPLSRLLLVAFGPAAVVGEEMAEVAGIESVWIFGSWAARYAGVDGPSPVDLDVLVVGSPTRDPVYAAADRIERRVLRPVHVAFRTSDEWTAPVSDPFIEEVKKRPRLRVGAGGSRD